MEDFSKLIRWRIVLVVFWFLFKVEEMTVKHCKLFEIVENPYISSPKKAKHSFSYVCSYEATRDSLQRMLPKDQEKADRLLDELIRRIDLIKNYLRFIREAAAYIKRKI